MTKLNHVPPHVAGYIDELESDRKRLAEIVKDLIRADGSTRLMRVQQAKQFLMEIGEGE
jgi:hypothetical protein